MEPTNWSHPICKIYLSTDIYQSHLHLSYHHSCGLFSSFSVAYRIVCNLSNRALFQKRLINLSILLTKATPYQDLHGLSPSFYMVYLPVTTWFISQFLCGLSPSFNLVYLPVFTWSITQFLCGLSNSIHLVPIKAASLAYRSISLIKRAFQLRYLYGLSRISSLS